MEIPDSHGRNIEIGGHVRYNGTGSSGEVLALRSDIEGTWAKLDSTNLWYNSRYLEVINKEEYLKLKKREARKKIQKADDESEKEEMAKKTIENLKKKIGEDIDMSNELCDGGG
jgi:hypothetical protein